jgi:hypothetical protein
MAMTYDVCVAGGGSGGFGAALAAARAGLRVLLIERDERLGGTSVQAGVNCWEPCVGGTGIPFDLYRRLKQIPDAVGIYSYGRHGCWYREGRDPFRYPGGESVIDPALRYRDTLLRHGCRGIHESEDFYRRFLHGIPFEPDAMAATMHAMLVETGCCEVILNTRVRGVDHRDGRIRQLSLDSGRTVEAAYVVDATGNADLCRAAGCEMLTGQEPRAQFGESGAPDQPTRRMNGVTLVYRVNRSSDVGVEPLPPDVPADCWWRGTFPSACINHYPCGDLNINRVRAHWHYLQSTFEEFRDFVLSWIAPRIGVREGPRVRCETVLTQHDLMQGIHRQPQDDIIALNDHPMDTHGESTGRAGCRYLETPYGIPYRCLIPKGFGNLLAACRGAGFTSIAASSCRLSRTMMQLGQAAGTAAALAVKQQVALPGVPAADLRQALRDQHAQVDWPTPDDLVLHLTREDPD